MEEKRTVTFRTFTEFGKCDSTDWDFDFEITEEEYQRLLMAARENFDFIDAKEVNDIYRRVYDAAVKQATRDCIENIPDVIEEYLDEGQSIEEWKADDVYYIGVNFPYETEKELEEE